MAVSRIQRQLNGGYRTRLAILLNRGSKVQPHRAASQRCYARPARHHSWLGITAAERQTAKHQTLTNGPPRNPTCDGSLSAPSSTAAELSLAIRACSTPAQLLELYRRHGTTFTPWHAHLALNRLVDVTWVPTPDDVDDDPSPSTTDDHEKHLAAQEQAGATRFQTVQLTGRLRVHQGQEIAQPPLHSTPAEAVPQLAEFPDPDKERRGSNYEASTSGPSSANEKNPLLARSQKAKQRSATHLPAVQPVSQPAQQQLESAQPVAASMGSSANVRAAASAQKQKQPPPPPRQVVVAMVSGLVTILSHSCHKLDGASVAATARALSRLRYQNSSLLKRLEQRTLKLLKGASGGPKGRAAAVHISGPVSDLKAREADGRTRRDSVSVKSSNPAAAAAAAAAEAMTSKESIDAVEQQRQQQVHWRKQQRQRNRPEAANSGSRRTSSSSYVAADDLFTLVHAFSALGHRPSAAWLAAIVQATEPHLPAYAASRRGRLPLLVSSLGTLGAAPPPGWLRAACTAAQPRLAACPPAQLRALAAGLAAMQHSPGDAWMADYLMSSERQLPDYSPWELVSTVAALAALHCSPGDSWMSRFYECSAALVGTPGGLTGRMAAVLLSSLSQLKCKPDSDWLTLLLLGTRRSLGEATAEELTDVLAALARLRFRPPEPWLQQYFAASFQRLPFQTPEQCCATAVALSLLGRRPQPLWLEELGRHVSGKLALMPAGQQTSAVAALVELGYEPSPAWLEAYEKQSNARLAENTPEELCRALTALATVGFKPQGSWLYALIMATYSKLDSFDSTQLALIFDRLPALTPHGSWLDAIIQICAAEAAFMAQQGTQKQELAAAEPLQQQQQQQQVQLQPVAQTQEGAMQQEAPGDAESKGAPVDVLAATQAPAAAAATASAAAVNLKTEALEVTTVAEQAPVQLSMEESAPGVSRSSAGAGQAGTSSNAASKVGDAMSGGSLAQREGVPAWAADAPLAAEVAVRTDAWPGAEGPRAPAPALSDTIPISPELVPTVGGVLSAATPGSRDPRAQLLNGAAGLAVGLLADGAEAGVGPDADPSVVGADAAASRQRISVPLAERLVAESGAMVAVALTTSGVSLDDGVSSSSSGGNSNGSGESVGSARGQGSSTGRSRRRGNGRGGGSGGDGDGGASGGRGGNDGWDEALFPDLAGPSPDGGPGASRPPDVGLLQRPRVAKSPAAGILVAAATVTPNTSANGPLSRAGDATAVTVVAIPPAAQQATALDGNPGDAWLGDQRGWGPATVPATTDNATAAIVGGTVTLQPKPRSPSSQKANAAGAATAAGAGGTALEPGPAGGNLVGKTPVTTGAMADATEASKPVLPYGTAAQEAMQRAAQVPAAAAATATQPGGAVTCSSAATTSANPAEDGRVQYLDSASLSRLIGPPDDPPGPDFSGCQKRAKGARAARGAGGPGPFQLGRVWNNDGGAGGGPLAGPVPSPSG